VRACLKASWSETGRSSFETQAPQNRKRPSNIACDFAAFSCYIQRMLSFEDIMRKGGAEAIAEATRFFMKDDRVHRSLLAITSKLRDLNIPYAVIGGMSLVAHGYDRTTEDVDILVDEQGLQKIHERLGGLGYAPPFKGSKNFRDVGTGVRIEFLVTGQYPGDGKPKPVVFPRPDEASIEIDGIRYLKLPAVIDLKLASGMTAPHRLRDLADVQELIRVLKLPSDFSNELNPYVREKYLELWRSIEASPDEE
jgi:hypothetical protein